MTPKRMNVSRESGRSQIPHGVQDRFLVEAARRRQAEATVRECFARWGYQEVIPPTYEYYENLKVGASAELEEAMYRFFDHRGRTLALRADFTPQVARMAATKLFDQPMPLRCCYMGSLFRHEEPQAGRKREFTQAGVELIGADTAAADAEVVALAIAVLEALGLGEFQVNLGQMAFFRVLTREMPGKVLAPIREAIDHKNRARLADALAQGGQRGKQYNLLTRLPDLVGGPEVLEEAQDLSASLSQGTKALAALERLAEVYRLLQAYGVGERVILDLSEVRGMDYYTGITFRGVAPGLGWAVSSGGRYDELIANFGRPLAAVGFGLGIERALLIQGQQGAPAPSPAPDLLMQCCDHADCLGLVRRLRQRGCRVEVDVLGLDEADLMAQVRQRGIPRLLRCSRGGWRLLEEAGQGVQASERLVSEEALLEACVTWRGGEGDGG
ncbi:MAG: ATP phosphoribosyltransferase regulatory subunit [Anaerolineae bacterium]